MEYIAKREVMKILQLTQAHWLAESKEVPGSEAATAILSLLMVEVSDLRGRWLDDEH